MGPPPDSYEKRQRERRKQRKRAEKLERRLQRSAVKRHGRAVGENAINHVFRRGEEEQLVDADVWLSVLDLAAAQGWVPVAPPPEDPDDSYYARPGGMSISEEDALSLARTIEAELPELSDERVAFNDHDFGEEHTEELLARRAEGRGVSSEETLAAREVLSGPPKWSAERLAKFLRGGAFTVDE